MKKFISAVALTVASFSAVANAAPLALEEEAAILGTIIVKEQCVNVDPANTATYEQLNVILPRILIQEGIRIEEHMDRVASYTIIANAMPEVLLKSACSAAIRLKNSAGL